MSAEKIEVMADSERENTEAVSVEVSGKYTLNIHAHYNCFIIPKQVKDIHL